MAMGLKRRLIRGRASKAPLAQAQLITATAPKITIPQSQTATPAARAAQNDFAGQADGVNTARINVNKAGDIVGGEFGFGANVQRYDPKKIAWVMGRGASGGSLSTADKAIYDRMMWLRAQKEAQEQQDAAEKKVAEADAAKRETDIQDYVAKQIFGKMVGVYDPTDQKYSQNLSGQFNDLVNVVRQTVKTRLQEY